MSLFIGVLAFPGAVDSPEQIEVKLGVIGGSIISAIGAAVVLALAGRRPRRDPAAAKPQVKPLAGSST
jgi:Na+:H+ antiporter, NhaA family